MFIFRDTFNIKFIIYNIKCTHKFKKNNNYKFTTYMAETRCSGDLKEKKIEFINCKIKHWDID